MRLDKFLAEQNLGSRSQVKELIKKKSVTVNGKVVTAPEFSVVPETDEITCMGKKLSYSQFEYFLLNKPAGVVSATRDALSETVLSLLPKNHRKDLFPVGRLDKDTEGLLIITNDGQLSHQLLSPKKHVAKTYLVKALKPLSDEDLNALNHGVDIGDETNTLPAFAMPIHDPDKDGYWIHLTITEGRFHQVKRMLEAIDNQVLFLKRIRFGGISLDTKLNPGECRRLTEEEISLLRDSKKIAERKKRLIRGKKAVIFDLDGSLVDSMWIWSEIDKEYLGSHGIPLESRTALKKKIEGMSFHETAVYFKENFPISDSIEKMKDDWNRMAWEKYEKEVPLKSGIPDFLEGCRRNGIQLGIATSNSRELVENVLGVHKIQDLFHSIVTGREILKGKPAPDIYLKVANDLGVRPEECLVFEDILPGLMAGKSAGMTICAVADADSNDTWEEKKAFADDYVYDFFDFFERQG